MILIGVLYFLVGFGSASLDPLVSDHLRFIWRLAAWIACAAVFAVHIRYEHFRLGNSLGATALHTALAVALGAFLLASAATVHAGIATSHAPYWRFLVALVAWPIITAVPAFLVALAVAAVLAHLPAKRLVE